MEDFRPAHEYYGLPKPEHYAERQIGPLLQSMVCRYEHFETAWYERWATKLGLDNPSDPSNRNIHRKLWEWCAISQALHERGMLQVGKRGCGFAVGTEPLPSLFASYGVDVLATDAPQDVGHESWRETGQHAANIDALHVPRLIDQKTFERRVSFRPVDMLGLAQLPAATFDFIWSSCSFEHLGSLDAGLKFVEDANRLLKSGGVAVHTTEFNLSSNDDTLTSGPQVLYRKQDLEALDRRMRKSQCGLARLDLYGGDHKYDLDYDTSPFHAGEQKHVKLMLDGYVATSVLLIIRKSG